MNSIGYDLSKTIRLANTIARESSQVDFIPAIYKEHGDKYLNEFIASTGVPMKTTPNPIDSIPLSTIRVQSAEQIVIAYIDSSNNPWGASILNKTVSSEYKDPDMQKTDMHQAINEGDMPSVPSTSTDPDGLENDIEVDRIGSVNDPAGITTEHSMGVKDAAMDTSGSDEWPVYFDETLFEDGTEDIAQQRNLVGYDLDKEDAIGDIGTDSAVMSAMDSSAQNNISAFQASNQLSSGQPQMVHKEMTQQKVEKLYDVVKQRTIRDEKNRNMTYNRLKNIESELMNIDNLVYVKHTMLTATELTHKLTNRMHRIVAVQKQLTSIAFKMNDNQNFYYHMALTMDNICDNLLVLLDHLRKNPKKTIVLDHIKSCISSALSYLSHTMSTVKESTKANDEAHMYQYSALIDNWIKRRENEENIARILKLDLSSGIDDSKFDKIMRDKQNRIVMEALSLMRQSSNTLQAFNTASHSKVQTAIDNRKLRFSSQKASDTVAKNTNNNMQSYARAPRNTTHPSRRLNALETPIAADKKQSIYVSGYENSKSFFNL